MEGVPSPAEDEEVRPISNFENMFSSFLSELSGAQSQVSELKRKERDWLGEKEALLKTSLEKEEGNKRIKLEISELKDKESDWILEKEDLINQLRQKDQELEGSKREARELNGRVSSLEDQLRGKSRQLTETGRLFQMAREELQKSADKFRNSADELQERVKDLERDGSLSEDPGPEERRRETSASPETDMNETDDGSYKEFSIGIGKVEDADVLITSEELDNANATPDLLESLDLQPQNQNVSETSSQVQDATTTFRPSSRTQTVKATTSTFFNEHGQAFTLEAAVDNFQDAKLAVEEGANSLVLLAFNKANGGLTPSAELATNVISCFPQIKVWILIRPSQNDHEYDQDDIKTMIRDMEHFKSLAAEGFVFGALNSKYEVDENICQKLIAAARPKKAYFHGAFDYVPQAIPALNTIIDLGFDRVMTKGLQEKAFAKRVECLKAIVQHGTNQIAITIRGGLTSRNVLKIIKQTGAVSVQARDAKQVGPIKAKIGKEYGTENEDNVESTNESDRDE